MIRRRLIQGKAQEAPEGEPIVDLGFQFRIGRNPEPFLKQHAFIQQHRRVGIGTFPAGTHGVMNQQNGFDAAPVDGFFQLFHGFQAAVVLQSFFHNQISKGKGLVQFFKSHDYPPVGFYREDSRKTADCQYKKDIIQYLMSKLFGLEKRAVKQNGKIRGYAKASFYDYRSVTI